MMVYHQQTGQVSLYLYHFNAFALVTSTSSVGTSVRLVICIVVVVYQLLNNSHPSVQEVLRHVLFPLLFRCKYEVD